MKFINNNDLKKIFVTFNNCSTESLVFKILKVINRLNLKLDKNNEMKL